MNEVGRNEPCPCGSGKKYKRCHGLVQAPVEDLLWRQVRSTRDSLVNQILEHADKVFGREAISKAWLDWCLEDGSPLTSDSQEFVTFIPWFLYEWIDEDALELDAIGDDSKDYPVAWSFLKKREGYLSVMERQFIEEALKETFTFLEVLETTPGEGFKLRDILTDREFEVSERSGSQHIPVGATIFGKVVRFGRVAILDSCSDVFLPAEWKVSILQLKSTLKKLSGGALDLDDLIEYEADIRSVYRELRESALNPPPPVMTNTNNEPLAFNKLIFQLTDPEAVFNKLHVLTFNESKEALNERATYDEAGKLVFVDFPWLKGGSRASKETSNTVLARLTIEPRRLTVQVNSMERALKARKKVEALGGSLIRYQTTLIEPLEAMLKEAESRSEETLAASQEEQAQLMNNPEIKAQVQAVLRQHLESWPNMKLPALGNRTPKQAVKTPEGREMVEVLLNDFERTAATRDPDGFERRVIQELRDKFGLKRS